MTKRLIVVLAVMAMMVGVMAPAGVAQGGVNSADLAAKGWDCALDNFPTGGAGVHCSKTSLGDFIAGGTGTLHLMVFSSPGDARYQDEEFLGTELLRFPNDGGELIAKHAWHGGFDPADHGE